MSESLKFGLFGAAAYVAPRHLRAIRELGHECVAALDPHDNVGILDSYFPRCQYFSELERFDRHVSKLGRRGEGLDWLSVCTPNYLHDSHCMAGLRYGANVICEKPIVLSPHNLDELQQEEEITGKRVYTVMQLRHHKELIALKATLDPTAYYSADLLYVTGRGPWFHHSWKGQEMWSGGIVFNIGVHLLDVLAWLFGSVKKTDVYYRDSGRIIGRLGLARASVRWFLSVSGEDIPRDTWPRIRTYRSLSVHGHDTVEFSGGFEDLHTEVYRQTLAGNGIGIDDARPAIELAHQIRHTEISAPSVPLDVHPNAERWVA